jgi:hypothetical protein
LFFFFLFEDEEDDFLVAEIGVTTFQRWDGRRGGVVDGATKALKAAAPGLAAATAVIVDAATNAVFLLVVIPIVSF